MMLNIHPLLTIHYWIHPTLLPLVLGRREKLRDFFETWNKTTVEKNEKAISVAGKYNSLKTDESEADINKQNIICVEELLYKAEKDGESFRMEKPSPIYQKTIVHFAVNNFCLWLLWKYRKTLKLKLLTCKRELHIYYKSSVFCLWLLLWMFWWISQIAETVACALTTATYKRKLSNYLELSVVCDRSE